MRRIYYKSKSFISNGIMIWIVSDLKCKIYKLNTYVSLRKYSKGKILKDYSYKYAIVEFENGNIVKLNKKYILIDVQDIMQKEVIYSISNATSALYNIHGNEIPNVTGTVLYPQMMKNNKIIVPLMYRTAEKLYKAENNFLKQGLTIKIYDTYRPYTVTKYLYQNTLKVAKKFTELLNGEVEGFEYSQRWFLAENASSHNYGVAIDMTVVSLENKQELEMQTKVHDLSIFSVVDYNNENAKNLARVMKKNGFASLRSEWWHFQDNDAKVSVMDFFI